jgi:hypothetical protein
LPVRFTRWQVKIGIAVDGFQFLGKAVKIGHGPATVIGCRWDARLVLAACPVDEPFDSAVGGFWGQAESQGTYPN